MDVIGAGFGRTGTLSLKAALEQVGFGPCAHFLPLMGDPERALRWIDAADGVPGALDAAIDGHRSTVDWPGVYFWRELIERDPEAKVLLTVRDPKAWYESMSKTIFVAAAQRASAPDAPPAGRVAQRIVMDGTFKGRCNDRDFVIGVFEEHNEAVRREVPADRLLEFEVKQGWAPLCEFLGVPVPSNDFPRLNDTAAFQERLRSHS
ncbi:sulfotransferase family protein [Actinoplanes sp. NPDC049265]|uniref:sulfotransferase family protein n=1 Tax=Actinoplanes sp. NPDC049265 TaxID=3363902 RepID=UPI00372321E9